MTVGDLAIFGVGVIFGAALLTASGLVCYNLGKRERAAPVARRRQSTRPVESAGDPVRPKGDADEYTDVRITR